MLVGLVLLLPCKSLFVEGLPWCCISFGRGSDRSLDSDSLCYSPGRAKGCQDETGREPQPEIPRVRDEGAVLVFRVSALVLPCVGKDGGTEGRGRRGWKVCSIECERATLPFLGLGSRMYCVPVGKADAPFLPVFAAILLYCGLLWWTYQCGYRGLCKY